MSYIEVSNDSKNRLAAKEVLRTIKQIDPRLRDNILGRLYCNLYEGSEINEFKTYYIPGGYYAAAWLKDLGVYSIRTSHPVALKYSKRNGNDDNLEEATKGLEGLLILSDDEINWESRKLGAIYGFSTLFVASLFGSKVLSLSSKMNFFSSVVFRAQPKQDSIVFSLYIEQLTQPRTNGSDTAKNNNNSNSSSSPLTSPLSDFDIADYSLSSVPVPVSSTNGQPVKDTGLRSPPVSTANTSSTETTRICRTVDRTWGQCEWLHSKIQTTFRLQALPPFTECPSSKQALADPLYVERYRVRIERWLNRLGARDDICQSASFDRFISNKLDETGRASGSKNPFSSLLMTLFGSGTIGSDRGFKVYTPIGEISEYDEDEEERRREYISNTEEAARELASAISNVHVQEESLGKAIVKVAQTIEKAYNPDLLQITPYDKPQLREATSLDSADVTSIIAAATSAFSVKNIEHQRLQVSLALLHNSAEAHYWATKELGVWQDMNLADVITEYCCLMVEGVKDVMDHSTQTLVMYEKTVQRHQQTEQRANSLRVQYPSDTPTVKSANELEAEAEREMDLAHQEYVDACDMATSELIRYERERAHGIVKALENVATVELDAAKARCQELHAMMRRIRSAQLVKDPPHPRTNIGPLLWQAAGAPHRHSHSHSHGDYTKYLVTPGSSLASSSTSANTYRHSSSMANMMRDAKGSGGALIIGDQRRSAHSIDSIHSANIRRAHTLDNGEFAEWSNDSQGVSSGPDDGRARNHSVFSEIDEEYFDYPLSASVAMFSAQTTPAASSSTSTRGSGSVDRTQQRQRWNGRISAMPFQGYDPDADTEVRLDVSQDRLSEIAVEAEMKAELVRSGMLTARQLTHKKSAPGVFTSNHSSSIHRAMTLPNMDAMSVPPVLPAFRSQELSRFARGKNIQTLSLRHSSSYTGLPKAASQGLVSPSEYLQYSRQTLLQQSTLISSKPYKGRHGGSKSMSGRPGNTFSNRSAVGLRSGAGSSSSGSSGSGNSSGNNNNVAAAAPQQQRIGRDYKGKARAFAT
ncbi:hypothetical protein GGI26_006425 [Coemansia sp. RSA 1358]|uniref:Uncharacterized protein n=1 Tax=Coemansia umbellata TaxID=1424467 RepID=A0ABQ8PD65_9FUNG|nr:hypothetical protein EDC05_006363 [Coemansia umbellata]KAJ2618682.1 hypothetical protein GGI26_006425 [Coemansia sp. RSA 1358]